MLHGEFIPKMNWIRLQGKNLKDSSHHRKQIEAKREEMSRERSARRQKKGKSDE